MKCEFLDAHCQQNCISRSEIFRGGECEFEKFSWFCQSGLGVEFSRTQVSQLQDTVLQMLSKTAIVEKNSQASWNPQGFFNSPRRLQNLQCRLSSHQVQNMSSADRPNEMRQKKERERLRIFVFLLLKFQKPLAILEIPLQLILCVYENSPPVAMAVSI